MNKLSIIGNLGKDVELRYTPSGQPVASFSVAVNKKWKDANGAQQKKTTWFRVTAWGKLGETCNEYLHKGSKVYLEGEIDASAWVKDDGTPMPSLEMTLRSMEFLDSKEDDNGNHGGAIFPDTLRWLWRDWPKN